jgi:hypothetical protein
MRNPTFIVSTLFLLQIVWSCSEEDSGPVDETLVFTEAYQIHIPSYQYIAEEMTYTVRGDTSYHDTDTLNSMPVFEWDTIGIYLITAAISTNPIRVSNSKIINTTDIIWQWHSGMENGNEGYVQYNDGKNVLHAETDSIDYEHPPAPLAEGHYYWAIWGWNQSGTDIWFSSRQMQFYVSN